MKHTLQNCLDPTYEKLCMALLLIYRSLQTFKTCNHHQNIMVSRSYCTILAISLVREGDDTLVRILRTLNSLSYRSCCTNMPSVRLYVLQLNSHAYAILLHSQLRLCLRYRTKQNDTKWCTANCANCDWMKSPACVVVVQLCSAIIRDKSYIGRR